MTSKLENGFTAFRANTGDEHPLKKLLDQDGDSNVTDSRQTKRANGQEPLTYMSTSIGPFWSGDISIGSSSPQTLSMQFDTGSADLIVPGTDCTTDSCAGHTQYRTTTSNSAVDLNKKFSITFGDTSGDKASGEQYSDHVNILGVTASGQKLAVASTYPPAFSKPIFPADGVLGMAYQSISATNATSLVKTLVADHQIPAAVFGLKLAQTGAELNLGSNDHSLYTGNFTYAPVTSRGFWQVELGGVSVDGEAVPGLTSNDSIIDSGTSYIMTSPSQAALFYQSIPGSRDASHTVGKGFFTFPCSSDPTVSLTFGGKSFSINPALFNLGKVTANSKDCIGAIIGGNKYKFWVIGGTFLQNVYASFDMDNNRVGFATLT